MLPKRPLSPGMGMMPMLGVLMVVQVFRRDGNYALMRPAREMLYVVLGKEGF